MSTIGNSGALLTIPQVADRLGVSASTVRRLISAGVLPAVRVGRRPVRIDPGELQEYVYGVPETHQGEHVGPQEAA